MLAVGNLAGAALIWTSDPSRAFIISTTVSLGLVVTAYGYWAVWVRRRHPGNVFLFCQALVDVALVTLLVHLTGGPNSAFPALYILVTSSYARSCSPSGADSWSRSRRRCSTLPTYTGDTRCARDWASGARIVIILGSYAVVALLATRLRQAGAERESLQTELRRARLQADDILQNIRSGVLTIDGSGRLAFLNPMGERLLQLDGPRMTGHPILDTLKHRSPEMWAAMVSAIRHGRKVSRSEGTVQHDDGRVFPIGLSTTTFDRDADGRPSVTAIFTDISDLKRIQELNLRAERLEAVAALSASLAHEIRNPLASIRSSVEQLARTAQADEDDRYLAQLIVRESDRLSRLLNEFLDFARVRATKFAPVDLQAVVTAAVRMVREHPDCKADTEIRVQGQRTVLEGDEDLLYRVVVNLVLNAAQAAKGPAVVTVTTGPAKVGDLPLGNNIEHPLRLEVRDTGPGIPEELRDRLFEPFVTGRSGGSGLGLAIVQRAVEAHRGVALVDSAPGKGTKFTIYFPARRASEVIE